MDYELILFRVRERVEMEQYRAAQFGASACVMPLLLGGFGGCQKVKIEKDRRLTVRTGK